MASLGGRQYGITAPLSTTLPTDAENQASNAMIEELKRQNNYESAIETQRRTEALASLQTIAEEFVKKVSRAQNKPDHVANSAGGKIFTFGSFRLGVFGPGSDIDTLVVGPSHVSRDDFFEYFPDLLVKMAPPGAITGLTPVVDAFVPIIKFEYSGISIDLIYSSIYTLKSIPPTLDLQDDKLLRGLGEAEIRSLNGTRVTDLILEVVPQKSIFRTALRGIKLWAQRRAIYANIMGFPGGVAWAMMVARVCQLYPKATSSVIIMKFFWVMKNWNWNQPVQLKEPIYDNPLGLEVRIWNPKVYKSDKFHIMPVITPAFPQMCATHNITRSTKEIIQRELERGHQITKEIMIDGTASWRDLFVKHTFFTQGYKYYLSVIAASTTKEAHKIWSGLVESKVRLLVSGLEGHESIRLAHPFNKGFDRVHNCKNDEAIEKAKNGSLDYQVLKELLLNGSNGEVKEAVKEEVKEEVQENVKAENSDSTTETNGTMETTSVYTTTFYIGLEMAEGARSLDLSWQVDDFKNKCLSWDKYNNELNALTVNHTRNWDLPNDVFTEGEAKPSRPQKKKTAAGQPKKRSAEDPNSAPANKRQQQTSVAAQG